MVVLIPKNLKEEQLGKRLTREFMKDSYWWGRDGNPIEFGETKKQLYGTLTKKKRNSKKVLDYKYTYIYDYKSEGLNPEKPQDLQMMIIELMTVFNVHEVILEANNDYEVYKIGDYYLDTTASLEYGSSFPQIYCTFKDKGKLPTDAVSKKDPSLTYDTLESAKKFNLTNEEYILSYFDSIGHRKEYDLRLSLDGIQNDETINEYRDSMRQYIPQEYSKIEEKIKGGNVTVDSITRCLQDNRENSFYSGNNIPENILQQIFERDGTLISRFDLSSIPVRLLNRFKPDFCAKNVPVGDDLIEAVGNIGTLYCEMDRYVPSNSKLIIKGPDFRVTFAFNDDGIRKIEEYVSKTIKERDEKRRKEELQAEIDSKNKEAEKMGYPSNKEFFHLPNSGVDQTEAFVIKSDGSVREPDYYESKNGIKVFDQISNGIKVFDQIFPGEIIFQYYRPYINKPYRLFIDWADREITDAQIERIKTILKENVKGNSDVQDGFDGPVITNISEWARSAVENKANKNEYKLVGGGMEVNEDPEVAFKREVMEEAGCEVEIIQRLGTTEEYRSLLNLKQTSNIFVAKVVKDIHHLNLTKKEKDEGAKLLWLEPEEALRLVTDCYDKLLPSLYDDVYDTRFVVLRDRKILEYYINNR